MAATLAGRIHVIEEDITKLHVDAVVNAANESLEPGGGVCGAIHDAAGPDLAEECRGLGHCPTGGARLTKGYDLPAKHVIQAVGPRYRDGRHREAELLRSCYEASLRLAAQHEIRTIAFPSISTSIFGYPQAEAYSIAVETVTAWLQGHDLPEQVTFCCFHSDVTELYRQRLRDHLEPNART